MNFDIKIVNSNIQYKNISSSEFNALEEIFEYNAWKNDHKIIQVLVRANEKISIELNIAEKDEMDFDIYAVKKIKAYTGKPFEPIPYKEDIERTEASDLLINTNVLELEKDETSAFFIDLHTKNANTSDLAFDFNGEIKKNININIVDKVVDTNQDFDIQLWQYPYSSAEFYGVKPFSDEHIDILKKHLKPYKELGGDAVVASICEDAWGGQTYSKEEIKFPSMIKWTLEEEMKYDFTDFDKWIDLTQEIGLGQRRIILYGMAPWHQSFTYYKDGELIKEKYDVKSIEYKERWLHFISHLYKHLREKNIEKKVFIGIDEQGFNDEIFEIIELASKEIGIDIKVSAAINDFENTKKYGKYIDYASVAFIEYDKGRDKFINFRNERKENNQTTTMYSCTGHKPGNFVLSHYGETYFTVVQSFVTDGFLRWAYDAWVENPLVDATHEFFEPGDCFLVYPYTNETKEPNISIRYLKIKEAIYDGYKLRSLFTQKELYDFFKTLDTKFVWSNLYPTSEEIQTLMKDIEKIKDLISNRG